MKKYLFKYKIYLISTLLGAILGYLYWYKIGCSTGTCPITSVWYNTSLYGALLGYLIRDLLKSTIIKNKVKNKQVNE